MARPPRAHIVRCHGIASRENTVGVPDGTDQVSAEIRPISGTGH